MREVPLAHIYAVGLPSGPIKVGYTSNNLKHRLHILSKAEIEPITLLASWPVHTSAAHIAERYAHFLLRDYHYHHEWFLAPFTSVAAAVPEAIAAAESGFALMPSLFRAGRSQRDGERVQNLKLPQGANARIEAVLREGEVRSDFIREAVNAELERREREKAPQAAKGAQPDDEPDLRRKGGKG